MYVANRFVIEFKREYTALTGVADPTRTVDARASEQTITKQSKEIYRLSQGTEVQRREKLVIEEEG